MGSPASGWVPKGAEGSLVPLVSAGCMKGSGACAVIAESSESGVTAQSLSYERDMPATSNRVYNSLQFLALLELEKFISMNFPVL